MITITDKDADRTVNVAVGETIEIRLAENATAGFRWTIAAIDRSVCEVTADQRLAPKTNTPGASGEHLWRLRGTRDGECSLELAYGRAWQSDASPTRAFRLRLRVGAVAP